MENKSPNQAANELMAFLTPLSEGEFIPDFNNELHKLVKAIRETRKGGVLTLTLKIAPMAGSLKQLVVNAEINAKTPKAARPTSIFFSDEEGGLHRSDPDQLKFNFEAKKD